MTDLRKKWIEALRSGKYRQCQDMLRSKGDGYCCLGVLCDIVDPSKWAVAAMGFDWQFADCKYLPPRDVLGEVGLTMEKARRLSSMNDNDFTFDQIADHLEKNQ